MWITSLLQKKELVYNNSVANNKVFNIKNHKYMGLHTDEHTGGRFLTVVAGKLREKVEEGTEGSVKRSGEVAGNPFEKWELVYPGITAFITKVELQDGKYGKNVLIHMTDANDEQFIVSMGAKDSRSGVPFMESLPNLDLTKEVTLSPYPKFKGKDGKDVDAGIKILQNGNRVYSAFYDPKAPEGEKQNLGMPSPKVKKDGSVNWTLYFEERDEWLQEYMVEQGFITVGEPYVAEADVVVEPTDDNI
jgi:hypothetical protein